MCGHHHVEQDEVAFGALADGQSLGAAHRRDDVEIFGRQPRFEQLDVGRNIVDDENASGHSLVLRIAQKMRMVSMNLPTEIGLLR